MRSCEGCYHSPVCILKEMLEDFPKSMTLDDFRDRIRSFVDGSRWVITLQPLFVDLLLIGMAEICKHYTHVDSELRSSDGEGNDGS
jgi:hypothetical protein